MYPSSFSVRLDTLVMGGGDWGSSMISGSSSGGVLAPFSALLGSLGLSIQNLSSRPFSFSFWLAWEYLSVW